MQTDFHDDIYLKPHQPKTHCKELAHALSLKTFCNQDREHLAEGLSQKDTNILFKISFNEVACSYYDNNNLLAHATTTTSINIVYFSTQIWHRKTSMHKSFPFLSRVMKPVSAAEHKIQQKQLAVSRMYIIVTDGK